MPWPDGTPTALEQSAVAALPLLIEFTSRASHGPRGNAIAIRIFDAMEKLLDIAGDAQAYLNTWPGADGTGDALAERLAAATKEYDDISAGRA